MIKIYQLNLLIKIITMNSYFIIIININVLQTKINCNKYFLTKCNLICKICKNLQFKNYNNMIQCLEMEVQVMN